MQQSQLIKKMTDKEIITNLYVTQLIIFLLAIILSWFLFDSWGDLWGLFKWDLFQIVVIGGGSALIIILFEMGLEKILPKDILDDGGINERIFRNQGVMQILILTMTIAFSEELLFRGVLQTHFGIFPASIIFALIHFRYVSKPVLFIITILLSFFLGGLYLLTDNLLVPIFCHFTIDFVLGCILRFRNKQNRV